MKLYFELIETFKEGSILGYEAVHDSDERLTGLLRTDKLNDEIEVLFEDGVGSLIACWGKNDDSPIIYLNSEGSPYAVVANNFREFLSLLYYGTYGVLEIEPYISYLKAKKRFEKRNAEFNRLMPDGSDVEYLNEITERLKSEYKSYDDIVNWLKKNGIDRPISPFKQILNAFQSNNNIEDRINSVLE